MCGTSGLLRTGSAEVVKVVRGLVFPSTFVRFTERLFVSCDILLPMQSFVRLLTIRACRIITSNKKQFYTRTVCASHLTEGLCLILS